MFPARIRLCLLLSVALTAAEVGREVVFTGKFYGTDPIPVLDKGYLLFKYRHRADVSVWSPQGKHVYDATIKVPGSASVRIDSAAIDARGHVAVAVRWSSSTGEKDGGFAMLDPSGKQIGFYSTGRYMPSHICFDQNSALWAWGWQRDKYRIDSEDTEDYATVRRFSADGKEIGAFIQRSLFTAKGAPGVAGGGIWTVRAAKDRIGAAIYHNYSDHPPEWLEWDYYGKLIGRWRIGDSHDGGLAFTDSGELYAFHNRVLKRFDRHNQRWQPVVSPFGTQIDTADMPGFTLGADRDHLVFSYRPYAGIRLRWFPAPQ